MQAELRTEETTPGKVLWAGGHRREYNGRERLQQKCNENSRQGWFTPSTAESADSSPRATVSRWRAAQKRHGPLLQRTTRRRKARWERRNMGESMASRYPLEKTLAKRAFPEDREVKVTEGPKASPPGASLSELRAAHRTGRRDWESHRAGHWAGGGGPSWLLLAAGHSRILLWPCPIRGDNIHIQVPGTVYAVSNLIMINQGMLWG